MPSLVRQPMGAGHQRGFPFLDGARGLAALLILVYHLPVGAGPLFHFSYLAVDLFYILSGFVIAFAYESRMASAKLTPGGFLRIRLARLLPLCVLAGVLGCAALIGGSLLRDDLRARDLLSWVGAIVLIPIYVGSPGYIFPANVPAWSLFHEILVNSVYAVSSRRLSTRILVILLSASAIGLIVSCLCHGSLAIGPSWGDSVIGLIRVVYGFGIGLICYRLHDQTTTERPSRPTMGFAGLGLSIGVLCVPNIPSPFSQFFECTVVLAVFPCAVWLMTLAGQAPRFASRSMLTLGVTSYGIYILQYPVLRVLNSTFHLHRVTEPTSIVLIGVAIAIPLTVTAWFLHRYYERPIQRLIVGR